MKVQCKLNVVRVVEFLDRPNLGIDVLLAIVAVMIVRLAILALVSFFHFVRVNQRPHGEQRVCFTEFFAAALSGIAVQVCRVEQSEAVA